MAYKGYVFHPFPRMVGSNKNSLGYVIVNSQEELDKLTEVEVPVAPKKKPGPKPKIKEE